MARSPHRSSAPPRRRAAAPFAQSSSAAVRSAARTASQTAVRPQTPEIAAETDLAAANKCSAGGERCR
eukprot:359602-Chlamydomonas_euryale.AAC.11